MRVSVIIPVFNGEKYLAHCLKSVARQTFPDIELIIVDNGSTDQSVEIIRRFATLYADKIDTLVLSEPRRGNSFARNKGIDHATGEFITFIDQDDYIDKDYLAVLYKQAVDTNADIVISGYRKVSSGGKKLQTIRLTPAEWSKFMNIAPWGKLFRARLVGNDHEINFLHVVKGEDVFFVLSAYNATARTVITGYVGYNWRDNPGSLTNGKHLKITKETSLLKLFHEIRFSLLPLNYIKESYLEYFLIKTMIYDVLRSCKREKTKSVLKYFHALSDWMDRYYPDNRRNRYVAIGKPRGERFLVSIIVTVFCFLRNVGLADLFLIFFSGCMKVVYAGN